MPRIPPEQSPDESRSHDVGAPLDYSHPRRRVRSTTAARVPKLIGGLTLGIAISAMAWSIAFASSASSPPRSALLLLAMKYIIAIGLSFSAEWRPIAIGLFISLPVGVVIFFLQCATHIKI